jgi:organic radical activating enzyme
MSFEPIKLVSNYKDVLNVVFMISNVCNYKCSYCFDNNHEGTHRFKEDWELVADNLIHLFDHYRKVSPKRRFEISLLGGEPTLWKNLSEFCEKLKQRSDTSIMLISNGSRTLDWWSRNAHKFDQVILSYHVEQTDLDHYINVADVLYNNNVVVTSLVMMDPDRWDDCLDAITQLQHSKKKWAINIQSLEDTSRRKITYTEDQVKFITENSLVRRGSWFHLLRNFNKSYYYDKEPIAVFKSGTSRRLASNEIMLNNWNHFQGWQCNIGVDSIFIDLLGRISGTCGQLLYGKDNHYNVYSKDFKDTFYPAIVPSICQQTSCLCVSEANLTKEQT